MGYRIEYGSQRQYSREKIRVGRIFWLTGACFLAFAFVTRHCWPQGQQLLEEALLPGDAAVTKQAFSLLTEQLRHGEAVGDAVAAFCREVIHGAAAN